MSENNKTMADIVAEKRELAEKIRLGTPSLDEIEAAVNLEFDANRIEAAWKLEKAELETLALSVGGMVEASRHKQVGNSAAMREALLAVKKSIDGIGASSLDCDPVILMSALTQICARISSRINAALSALSRNCDILSADQCKKMFEHEMGIYLPKEATDRDRDIVRRTAYGVIDALYAERKGESDGK